MYRYAACQIVWGLSRDHSAFESSSFVRALITFDEDTCFPELSTDFMNEFRLLLFVSYKHTPVLFLPR